ncbi:MAG: diheme cytochrome c-553 [Acidobacteria bacterium]|nr:diheme cytochrome c-553 [Acidobacteriota bacterium]
MHLFQYRVPLVAACLPIAVAISACNQPPAAPPAAPAPAAAPTQTPTERGKVLVTVGGCHDCHTTKKLGPKGPEPDMDKMLSGHPEGIKVAVPYKPAAGSPWTIATTDTLTAWSGPWGVSFAANLTPDTNTGLRSGVWTEELFINALRTGKHMGTSREILPPMPWSFYSQLSDDDLKAIWAYLGTIPAINNHVPDPIPPAGAPPK